METNSFAEQFASAQFTDDNASGVTEKMALREISNLTAVHMGDAAAVVESNRDILHRWKKEIHMLFDSYGTKWVERMVKPVETVDRVVQLNSIVGKLTHPMFNPSASWITTDISSPVKKDKIDAELETELGIAPATFESTLRSLHSVYASTVHHMFELDTIIQEKLKKVQDLHKHLLALPPLVPEMEEAATLHTSIYSYTAKMLEAHNIHEEYPRFIHMLGKFYKLRSMLQLSSAFREKDVQTPCTICMAAEIDTVLIPCGHTFCKTCSKHANNICFLCRTTVLQTQRIFM